MNEQIIVLLAIVLLTGVSILGWHWFITRVVYHYSGVEFIWRKLIPAKQEQKHLPTLPLWLISIYVAVHGIASQRYENKIDLIENKVNTINFQLASTEPETKGMAFVMIPDIQKMECPYKPEIKNPASIYLSLFKQSTYEGVENLMIETVQDWKGNLANIKFPMEINFSGADLSLANLEGADLTFANLEGANLMQANLKGANLYVANLAGTILVGADLSGANLGAANLSGANLREAILKGTDLLYATFNGACLEDVNLEGAEGLSIKRLIKAETLYLSKLDDNFMKEIEANIKNKERWDYLFSEESFNENKWEFEEKQH